MGNTRFSGPVSSGDIPNSYSVGSTNYTANVGLAVLTQSVTINAGAATTNVATAFLPQQSQILGVYANTVIGWSTTTAALSVGTPTTNTAYLTGTTTIAVAGQTAFFALGTAAANIGTTPGVVFTVNQGQANGTGSTLVTLQYVQTTSTFS